MAAVWSVSLHMLKHQLEKGALPQLMCGSILAGVQVLLVHLHLHLVPQLVCNVVMLELLHLHLHLACT